MNKPLAILLAPSDSSGVLQVVDTPRFRLWLIGALCVLAGSLYFFADRLAAKTEEDALHRLAKSHADLLISFRNFYSSKLLPVVRQHSELAITHDYKDRTGALPIPATMTIDLVAEVAKSHPEMNLRLVSEFPFPWRKVTLEPFDKEALTQLQQSGKSEYMLVENSPQGRVLRYAAPIRLEQSCVSCHNSHPDSPKVDWKAGDVRGVQVMTLPLAGLALSNNPMYFLFASLFLAAFVASGAVLVWLHGRNVRAVRLAQAHEAEMLDRQKALDAHGIVSITDRKGFIEYANDQFCKISGYTREELLGQNHRLLKSDIHPESFYQDMWRTVAKGGVWEGEICNKRKDGSLYWVKSTIVPFLDASGRPHQYIAVRTDISGRKAVEHELISKRVDAEAANRAKSDFLANMSHEIRTPMNGIIGMTTLALDTDSEQERQEYLKIVRSSSESLLGILNDILDFSKIEANKLLLERTGFDLRQTISDTLKTLSPRASQKGLELMCDFDADVPSSVLGDPTRLRQVVVNLVGNAIKFTQTGEIVVSVSVESRSDTDVILSMAVRDSGIGIAADKLDSIFEAFSQADVSTTRKYGGTGLGLSISSRLVELMGGRMTVESELGKGSTFHMTIALGIDEAPVIPLETGLLAGKSVLVVDDNAVNREILMRQLKRWDMEVITLESAFSAQAWCEKSVPELVVLDHHMPDMDGMALAEWLRTREGTRSTPIVVLSSGTSKGDTQRISGLQLSGLLSKPITDADLLAAVCKALGSPQTAAATATARTRATESATQSLRVLLVEDNAINQMLATRLLESWGHHVTLAENGQEALDQWGGTDLFDVVLMDMQMPIMGGVEATRLLRAQEKANDLPRVPIVAMTANAMQSDRDLCMEAGMDFFLTKPIVRAELSQTLLSIGARLEARSMVSSDQFATNFDYGQALSEADTEVVEIIAQAFLKGYQTELDAMRQAMAEGEMADLARRAHGLRASLAAFGAEPAVQLARQIEQHAGDSTGMPVLEPALQRLNQEIAHLSAALSRR
jgi:two-component system sensor histidine kinase/response regulator